MEVNKEVLASQLPMVTAFIQQLAYFRGLKEALAQVPEYRIFWSVTLNNHLKQAVVDWCKVFGSPKEDIHWSKTPARNILDQASQDFQRRVLAKTGFTQEQWEHYQKTMLVMRDKYVAHLDLKKPITEDVPLFDAALQVAYVYQEWVRQLLKPNVVMSSYPFNLDYDSWKAEAFTIASRYGHP